MALVKSILLLIVAAKVGEASSRKKVFACENSSLSLSCLPGTTLHFVRANFGRFSLSVCPSTSSSSTGSWSTRCLQPTSLRQLTAQCGGKASCDLKVDSETFGDPCPGTPKYLQLLYSCVDARDTSTASPLLPPWMVALESMRESVVLGPASTTERSTTTSTSTVEPSTSTSTSSTHRVSSTSSPPLKRTPEVRRPSMEFLMFIQRKEQERLQQAENLFLNMPKVMSKAETESEAEDNTILIAATISIIACILILGVTAIVVYRLKKREQKTGQNNVYQISSATSSASSSYMQYSSSTASSTSTPGTDYTYMLGSDGRTYRTVTPLSRSALPLTSSSQHSLLQPVPVLQTWHPANLTGEELYVDIDGQQQGKQQQMQYQQQISQYQPTANQYQPLGGGQYLHQSQTSFLQCHQQTQPHNLEPHVSSAFYCQ